MNSKTPLKQHFVTFGDGNASKKQFVNFKEGLSKELKPFVSFRTTNSAAVGSKLAGTLSTTNLAPLTTSVLPTEEIIQNTVVKTDILSCDKPPMVPATLQATAKKNRQNVFYFNNGATFVNDTFFINGELRIISEDSYINKEGICAACFYKIEVVSNGEFYIKDVSSNEIDNESWLKDLTHNKVYINRVRGCNDLFHTFIHRLISETNYPRRTAYIENGWNNIPGYNWRYVSGNEIFGLSIPHIIGKSNVSLSYSPTFIGSPVVMQHILNVPKLTPNNPTPILTFVYLHMSLLQTLLKEIGFPIHFTPMIVGPSNAKKTSIAYELIQPWLPENCLTTSFLSTKGALASKLSLEHDTITLVDDFAPNEHSHESKQQADVLRLLVRTIGDGIAKERLAISSKDNHTTSYGIKGTLFMTGEYVDAVHSTLTRMILMNLTHNDVDIDVLSAFQNGRELYRTYIVGFLLYISGNPEQIMMQLKSRITALRSEFRNSFCEPRFAEYCAQFFAFIELISCYWRSTGTIHDSEIQYNESLYKQGISSILLQNSEQAKSRDSNVIFACMIKWLIDDRGIVPISVTEVTEQNNFYVDDDFYYIHPAFAEQMYADFLNENMFSLPKLDSKELSIRLELGNLLITAMEGRTKRRTVKPKALRSIDTRRLMQISKREVERILNENNL